MVVANKTVLGKKLAHGDRLIGVEEDHRKMMEYRMSQKAVLKPNPG